MYPFDPPLSIELPAILTAIRPRPQYAALLAKLERSKFVLSPNERIRLMLGEALAHELAGNGSQVLQLVEQALDKACQIGDRNLQAAALAHIAYGTVAAGEYAEGIKLAEESLALTKTIHESNTAWRAIGVAYTMLCKEWDKAEHAFIQAIKLCQRLNFVQGLIGGFFGLAQIYMARGKFQLALETMRQAEPLEEAGFWRWAIFAIRARAYIYVGDYSNARRMIEELHLFATQSDFVNIHYHHALAQLLISEERLADVHASLQWLTDQAQRQLDAGIQNSVRLFLAELLWYKDELAAALEWINQFIQISQQTQNHDDLHIAFMLRARIHHAFDDPACALGDLETAITRADELDAAHIAAWTRLVRAVWSAGQSLDSAEAEFVEAATRIRRGGYAFIYERERATIYPLLAQFAKSKNTEVRRASEQALEQIGRMPPAPLYVWGLGRFRVQQGQRTIDDAQWTRRRAGELFRFLLLQPRRSALRETVIDAFWPDQTLEQAQPALHQATSTLRRILEPDLPDKFPSRYLLVEGDQLRLHLPLGSTLDFEQFERTIQSADSDQWQSALASYGGALFAQDRYHDWATFASERLAELYLRGLIKAAEHALQNGATDKALDLSKRALAHEAWSEDAALIGMKAALALHDRPTAIKLYRNLESVLRQELGIVPREDLRSLFASLVVPAVRQ